MKVELEISKEEFETEAKEKIEYLSCMAEILGEKIRFYPKEEDKRLLKHLVLKSEELNGGK